MISNVWEPPTPRARALDAPNPTPLAKRLQQLQVEQPFQNRNVNTHSHTRTHTGAQERALWGGDTFRRTRDSPCCVEALLIRSLAQHVLDGGDGVGGDAPGVVLRGCAVRVLGAVRVLRVLLGAPLPVDPRSRGVRGALAYAVDASRREARTQLAGGSRLRSLSPRSAYSRPAWSSGAAGAPPPPRAPPRTLPPPPPTEWSRMEQHLRLLRAPSTTPRPCSATLPRRTPPLPEAETQDDGLKHAHGVPGWW